MNEFLPPYKCWTPWTISWLYLSSSFQLSLLPTIINKNGDNGSPYLNPLLRLNISVGFPFTRIGNELLNIQLSIYFIHLSPNPNLFNIYLRNFHDTQSFAFSLSTFNINHPLFCLLAIVITSFITTKLPKICLSGKNADWLFQISFPKIFFNLVAKIFSRILYKYSNKQMGLNSYRTWGFSTLGINLIQNDVIALEKVDLSWNSLIKSTTSTLIISYQFFIKFRLKSSSLGRFLPSVSQITLLISS